MSERKSSLDSPLVYWIFAGIVLGGCLFYIFAAGFKSRPVPKMKLSHFDRIEVFADALALRLWQELQEQPVLILGIESGIQPPDPENNLKQEKKWLSPEELAVYREVAQRIILKSQFEKYRFDLVLIDSRLGTFSDLPDSKYLNFFEQRQALVAVLTEALQKNQRVLLLTTELDASHLVPSNLIEFLELQGLTQFNALAVLNFPTLRDEERSFAKPCVPASVTVTVTGSLGCEIFRQARLQYPKILREDRPFVGFASMVKSRHYLGFFSQR